MVSLNSGSWKQYLARVAVLCGGIAVAVFAGNRLANAGPGEPLRKSLTVAGALTGVSGGTATAAFRFYRAMGDSTPLCAPEVTIRDGIERNAASGAFSVEVPLTQSGHECPDTLFHDPSAYVEVAIAGSVVAPRAPVNPVPYAVYAQQYGTPDCPAGYERAAESSFNGNMRLCKKFQGAGSARSVIDEIVRVGVGPSAFWIDRFESIAVEMLPGGAENTRFGGPTDFGALPRSGQWRTSAQLTPPVLARSVSGAPPAQWISWFQAQEACRASGKRLPTGDEWGTAAQGTPDPASPELGAGTEGRCLTNAGTVRPTGGRAPDVGVIGCQSAWGAQDMIGNVEEWTADWYASAGALTSVPSSTGSAPIVSARRVNSGIAPWPAAYRDDGTYNLTSAATTDSPGGDVTGVPAAAIRGGFCRSGVRAGIFNVNLELAPSSWGAEVGFRCVIPR